MAYDRRGDKNPKWRGGRVRGGGNLRYWMVQRPDHPRASQTGYVLEHRLVMEEHLGRFLERHEVVHHINGDSLDNRLENLEVITQNDHARHHTAQRDRTPGGQLVKGGATDVSLT